MPDSFEDRIAAAESQLAAARDRRDREYPGSPTWESEHGKVEEWEATLRELRREARG